MHRVIPLLLIHRDGWQEYRCLECNRPVAPSRGEYYRHYQRKGLWRPAGPRFP